MRLYVAGNAANNNNNNDSGDKVYTKTLDLTPADSSLPSNFRVLPQFVSGGGSTGFYSALYLYNGGDVTANFLVHFFDAAGQPMSVPVSPGVSSPNHTVSIPARGLTVIEAPNTAGSTTSEGWAAVELPANVTASGVFRLSAGGAPDQEAVVPLASNSSKDVILVFDDRENMRTGVAIANPTGESIQVNIVARDDSGTTIGITSKNVPPRGKQPSFFLEDDANLAGMKGKKGTVEFTVGTGAVSVLGLRVRGLAFTSIPAIER